MKEFKFSGEDLILVFDFLSHLVEEADSIDINEGQLMVYIPHMLNKTATRKYRSNSSENRANVLEYWSEAMQYFLRAYSTDSAIREAPEHLENIRRNTNETENSYESRIGDADYRCGNVHTDDEKISIFTKGFFYRLSSPSWNVFDVNNHIMY